MKLHRCIGVVILTLFTILSMGQSVPVTFTVKDYQSREPLIGANILIEGQPAGATDEEGKLEVFVKSSRQSFKVSYIGYDLYEGSFDVEKLEGPRIEVLLRPSSTLLNEATVTGSRYEKPLSESTVSIDVLKPDLITRTAAPDIQEVLNRMPGVQLMDGQANIRGGSGWSYGAGSRVALLLDDIPILQVDAAIPNWNDIPIENISRVEILKGAASALYGSSALNGIINVRTDYAKSEPETQFALQGTYFFMPDDSLDYGHRYSANASFVHRQKFNRWDVVLGGFYNNQEDHNIGTYNKYGRVNANVRWRIKDNFVVGVNSIFAPGKSRNYFYWDANKSFRGELSSFNQTDRIRFNIDPYIRWQSGDWSHKVLGRVYRTNNDVGKNQSNESWMTYTEYQTRYNIRPLDANVIAGGVYTNTQVEAELYSDTVFTNRNIAFYTQIEKTLWDRLNISAGVRYEHNALFVPEYIDGDTIPDGQITESRPVFRFGLNYELGDYTFLRASWGEGYRFPSIAEKFIDTQAGAIRVRPNVDLGSEDGWSSEIGIRQGVGGGSWNGFLDFAVFWSRYDNMIEFSVDKDNQGFLFFQAKNVGGTSIAGLELNGFMNASFGDINGRCQAGYTFIEPRFLEFDKSGSDANVTDPTLTQGQENAAKSTSEENVLKYRSKHNFKFDIQMDYRSWFGGVGFNYVSEMLAIDKSLVFQVTGLSAPQDDDMEGYRTVDFRLGYTFGAFKLQLQLKNAFDERYTARPAYLEAPRNLTLRLDYDI